MKNSLVQKYAETKNDDIAMVISENIDDFLNDTDFLAIEFQFSKIFEKSRRSLKQKSLIPLRDYQTITILI